MSRLFTSGVLLIFTAIFFTGCELTDQSEFQPRMVFHCLLRTGENQLRAKVNHTYKINQPFDSTFTGASILLSSRTGQWTFTYNGGDSYITTTPVQVDTGDTWQVLVTHPDYDTIQATTTVPGNFTITYPGPGDTVSINDSMVWTRSRGAMGYYMAFRELESRDTFYWDVLIPNDSFGSNYDSLFVRLPVMFFLYTMSPPPDSPPRACTLRLWALDTNYYFWIMDDRTGLGTGENTPLSRVHGGLGVLGSAVEQILPLFVRGDTALPPRRRQD